MLESNKLIADFLGLEVSESEEVPTNNALNLLNGTMKMADKKIKSVDIINITKVSEVLTGNPTYLRLKGSNKRLPQDCEQQVSELLSLVEGWLVKYNK